VYRIPETDCCGIVGSSFFKRIKISADVDFNGLVVDDPNAGFVIGFDGINLESEGLNAFLRGKARIVPCFFFLFVDRFCLFTLYDLTVDCPSPMVRDTSERLALFGSGKR